MRGQDTQRRIWRWMAVAIGLGLLAAAGPATAQDPFEDLDSQFETQGPRIADPLEPWNRLMFEVNDRLYFYLLKPVARGYKAVVPEPARLGVRNFFTNLKAPLRFTACLLQGKGQQAGHELSAFVINATFGALGFFTPANREPALKNLPAEDLGQSLAVWGIGHGPYLVWPLLGPSSLRDSVGRAGGYFLGPLNYVEPSETGLVASGVDTVNTTSLHLGEYEAFKKDAVAPYEAMRDIYVQYRQHQVEQ
ncbi:MAG: VacJ family lipoprotein [Deltaproteobacteria bacterium]|nr:VacJ family lipoprotein [Deltaproteobacteria bacterium]MBW2355243.1 VacJ family lipoprotein [Deltaproteobacteria bacterium]